MGCGNMKQKAQSKYEHLKPKFILSIYGGGIRGILPATILVEIERRYSAFKNKRVYIAEIFDLLCGTSTGGILSLGSTMPNDQGTPKYSARDLLEIYTKQATRVFQRGGKLNKKVSEYQEGVMKNVLGLVGKAVDGVNDVTQIKYEAEGLEMLLKEYFNNSQIKIAYKEILITSYNVEKKCPVYFTKKTDGEVGFVDVARATSAAPTFFFPKKIGNYNYIDGGTAVNNPSMRGITYAYNELNWDIKNMYVLSLGTGKYPAEIPSDKGALYWADKIFEVCSQGDEHAADEDSQRLLQKGCYFHIQPVLTKQVQLDGTDKANVDDLIQIGIQAVNNFSQQIDSFLRAYDSTYVRNQVKESQFD